MSKVVFILGAGASRQCGAPLMSDFLDTAADLLLSERVKDKQEQFKKVFKVISGLQASHSKAQLDLNNIESIFTALELGRIIQKVPGTSPDEIENAIEALKELIVKTLEVTVRFPLNEYHQIIAPEPYGQFANLIRQITDNIRPNRSVSILTFNYDIAIDMALFRQELGPDYVIERSPNRRNQIQLLKLHGSLNWATERTENSKQIRPLHLSEYFNHYNTPLGTKTAFIPIGSQLKEFFSKYKNCEVDPAPVIVPPSWNKADYHLALSKIWAAGAAQLSEAEYIFIIGYSLPETDSFFRHLYSLGSVGDSTLRRITVFNPDTSGQVDSRFRSLLGPGAISRYNYEQSTFSESIAKIMHIFQSN